MALLARRMLEVLDERGLVVTAPCEPSVDLVEAANRLASLLSDWSDAAAGSLFADNVALDNPFARRADEAANLVRDHGPLTVSRVSSETPMRGQVTMCHIDATERVFELELAPLVPPRLQVYEVAPG
jgi:hypothetical protein